MTSTTPDSRVGRTGARFGRPASGADAEPATVTEPAARPDVRPAVGQTGARFGGSRTRGVDRSSAPAGSDPAPGAAADGPVFEAALRGYDRSQVDEFLARQDVAAAALRAELSEAERMLQTAADRIESLESETGRLQTSLAKQRAAASERGFGARAEKLLRLAENEAAELRDRTIREAAELLERSRAEAEQHRHEVEQSLIARAAELDRIAVHRDTQLAEQEEHLAGQRAAMRAEASRVSAEALRDAGRVRAEADADAEATRARLRAEAERIRGEAKQDADRLDEVKRRTQTEIRRMTRVLLASLGPDGLDPDEPPADESTSPE